MPTKYFNLQLFAEDVSVGVDTGSMDVAESTVAENSDVNGVATEDTGDQVAPEQIESFDSLIKGRYKKDYDAAVQKAVNRRFRNQQNLQEKVDKIDPLVRLIANKYGVNPEADGSLSIDAITKALEGDDSIYENEAFQRGMSVEDLKQMKRLEAENQRFRMQSQRTAEQREWDSIVSQGDELKQLYPEFDLDTEMADAQFGRLLATFQRSGFPNAVRTAYEAMHRDEIMSGAMQHAVKQTEQKISNSLQSGMRRPIENGVASQGAAKVGQTDPSKFTKAQLDDIKRRAERGERITF